MRLDKIGEEDEVDALAVFFAGQANQAWQQAGNLHDAEQGFALAVFEQKGDAEGFVDQAG